MDNVSILNVGAGDTKLTFDPNNTAERIRSARIVRDMIRRGYALLIEVDRDGEKKFERAIDFKEDTCEYIIADLDPEQAVRVDQSDAHLQANRRLEQNLRDEEESNDGEGGAAEGPEAESGTSDRQGGKTNRRGRPRKAIDAAGTRAVAVHRSAGG